MCRGGVLFNKTANRFYCYRDKVLCTATIKRTIIARFYLPRRQTTLQTDLHDTTDPEAPDQLFSQ
jgi:hypothetical protein